MASPVTALFLLALIFMGSEAAYPLSDCCLKTTNKVVPKKYASDYIIQEAGQGCKIDATIIITKGNVKLCIPHPDRSQPVAGLIAYLDSKKSASNKVHNKRSTN
ncbi:uncharacterized protein ACB058_006505 [Synchiropus picturatus]